MKKIIKIILILSIISPMLFCFGCSNENNRESNGVQTIALTLENYDSYFALQTEIITHSENPYTSSPGNFSCIRANQSTKISIIILKSDIIFDSVEMNIVIDKTSISPFWIGGGDILKISFDGKGSISLTASYDDYYSGFKPLKYKISRIIGNAIIKN